jgi:TM2 domain-containing membrane protein YozV
MLPEERYDDLIRRVPRPPNPGLAAVLSVIVPGLGHVYAGRLGAGLGWFIATMFGYWAILVPGFAIHVASVFFAYEAAKHFRSY